MSQEQPFFSIVIPSYNRPKRLANCLEALARLDYPRDRFEVIVVDDGSEPPLESVVAAFGTQLPVSCIRQANSGPAKARNAGAAKAKGEFLAFTDDDCAPAPDWLKTLSTRFATAPDALVGGKTLNAIPHNLYSTASQTLTDFLYRYYLRDSEQPNFFASNNFAVPAQLFRDLGGFDPNFPLAAGEDREFCDRWLERQQQMVYLPEALVYHSHDLTLKTFWRQHFNYGRGAFHFHRSRSRRQTEPVKVERLNFYTNLLRYPFNSGSQQPPLLVASLFVLSQIANVSGFFWESKRGAA